MPEDSFLCPSSKGSMEKGIIHFIIDHMHMKARKTFNECRSLLLFLDGHKSRGGFEWLEKGNKCKIEVIQAPANTSHFLQPCDPTMNKNFSDAVKCMRDWFTKKLL